VTAGSLTGVRWYEFRLDPQGGLSAYQQGTYAPDSSNRWMGSAAMDKAGNIGMSYSVSSTGLHPQLHFTGRLAGDALGTMGQGENTFINGAGSQTGSLARWGDYASMSIDPVDDCTFWFSSEYLKVNGSFNWSTRIGSFALPGCTPSAPPSTPANDFSIAVAPSSGSVTAGASTTSTVSTTVVSGSPGTVSLSASGLPAGATATFSPTSVSTPGSSTMTVTTTTATPAGTYQVLVIGTASSATHSAPYTLTVSAPAGSSPILNGGFENGSLTGWTLTGSTGTTTSAPHSGTYAALVGSTSPSGTSSIAQTFTAPSGSSTLSFYYNVTCHDTVTYDWATATLKDNGTGATTTLLAKTCTSGQGWKQASGGLAAGHSYTLTLTSKDDNYAGDPTYTTYDDVTVG